MSKKHAERLAGYRKKRIEFLEMNKECQVCWKAPAIQVHHMKGRGKYTDDETTFLAVCQPCHRWIHDNPKEAMDMGYILQR